MGITHAILRVRKTREATPEVELRVIIDSGPMYSLVPEKMLRRLGIEPYRELEYRLTDGTTISRKAGGAYFELNGQGAPSPVIFGEEGDEPLLGAITLEALGFFLNPLTRTLHPMRMPLMQML